MGPKRLRCPRCELPLGARASACICRWIAEPAIAHEVELLILQHPDERDEAKGTARLLQLSLANCRLLRGERFEPPPADGRLDLLLYPDTPALPAPPAPVEPLPPLDRLRLIVIDGSWRKSHRLLHENRWLQRLPRLALRDAAAIESPYAALRKARRAGQLSTLEAAALALQQLEPGVAPRLAPLWAGFAGFVEQQQALRR